MRMGVFVAVLALTAAALADDAKGPVVIDFEKDSVGGAPEGFAFGRTGTGPEGVWVVQTVEGAPSGTKVAAQISTDDTDRRFPVAVWTLGSWTNVAVSVRLKAIAGEVDQAGGLVVRYTDANHYYVARVNALEGNCRFYYVKDGERRQLGSTNVDLRAGTWYTLKVQAKGTKFVVWFDGKEVLQLEDRTFTSAGAVGLWTKSDSVTQFDDLTIEEVE